MQQAPKSTRSRSTIELTVRHHRTRPLQMDPTIDRRKFLISGASLAGAISLPSVARATQPSPSYVRVKLLVLNYQAVTLDRDLRSIVPDGGDMLPSLANH